MLSGKGTPRFFCSSQKEKFIECKLCPGNCILPPGGKGACKVRQNIDGKPSLPYYGFITALAGDPIEKKPLYHFRPGTEILSAGFTGCNLRCPFCQNWRISQDTETSGRFCSPAELAAAAQKSGQSLAAKQSIAAMQSLAYTYSEPLVHAEFLLDCMREARKAGVANVLVTNGCVNAEAAEEILDLCDAANIDLKCFSEETYSKVLGGDLGTALNFIKTAYKKGVHIELTTLVVPELNDSEEELGACANFIAELENSGNSAYGKQAIPWHLSAYHPDWKWKAPATTAHSLNEAAARAKKQLAYVYAGNLAGEINNTNCVHCGKTLVSRLGYSVDTTGLSLKTENGKSAYFCASCGKKAPIRY